MQTRIVPRPIETAPIAIGHGEEPITLLLYCPEQGEWLVGAWLRTGIYDGVVVQQGWRWAADRMVELRPTHWLPYSLVPAKGSVVPLVPTHSR